MAVTGFRGNAEHGDLPAASLLGNMYLYGRGVPIDDQEAPRWFRKAADGGFAGGQYDVGSCANGACRETIPKRRSGTPRPPSEDFLILRLPSPGVFSHGEGNPDPKRATSDLL
jgi:TPR repeat protein